MDYLSLFSRKFASCAVVFQDYIGARMPIGIGEGCAFFPGLVSVHRPRAFYVRLFAERFLLICFVDALDPGHLVFEPVRKFAVLELEGFVVLCVIIILLFSFFGYFRRFWVIE